MVYRPKVTNIKQSLIRSQANLGPVVVDFQGALPGFSSYHWLLAIFLVFLVQPCSRAASSLQHASC